MNKFLFILAALMLSTNYSVVMAEENITIIAPTSEVANGLDLYAVSELFKDTANLEDFESELNNPDYGINNLDLDGDGYVDYIRVLEEIIDSTHIIILQAAIGKDEYQDVATIEIENTGNDYNMHVHGNEVIYGTNYYIAPHHVHVSAWPIISWIYRPIYRPYHSAFYWGYYPRWWKPFRPLHINVYRNRTKHFTQRKTFVISRNARVKSVTRIKHKPKKSVRVTRHVAYKKTNSKNRKTTKTRVAVKKTSNRKTGKTTVKKGVSRTKNQNGIKTTVKKGKSTTVNSAGNKTTVKKTKTKTKTKNKNTKKVTTKKTKQTKKTEKKNKEN